MEYTDSYINKRANESSSKQAKEKGWTKEEQERWRIEMIRRAKMVRERYGRIST
jgi:hypothetical protein